MVFSWVDCTFPCEMAMSAAIPSSSNPSHPSPPHPRQRFLDNPPRTRTLLTPGPRPPVPHRPHPHPGWMPHHRGAASCASVRLIYRRTSVLPYQVLVSPCLVSPSHPRPEL